MRKDRRRIFDRISSSQHSRGGSLDIGKGAMHPRRQQQANSIPGVVFDITDRKVAEQQLAKLNETLETQVSERTRERDRLWRNSRDLLVVLDTHGIFHAANPAWTTILGWRQEEIVGRSYLEFIHPESHEASRAALVRASHEGLQSYESRYRHKDGSYRWLSWVAAPEDGLIYATGRNVTKEKEDAAQLNATQEQLRQAQKMEAVGQLTGGLAHDFNNMLAIITGSLDMARRRLSKGVVQIEPYLDNALEGAKRATVLTQRLLAFSRQQPLAPEVVEPNRLVAGMSELLRHTLGERIEIQTVLAGGLWLTAVDPHQLENAILNLAVNARDAMPDGGKLTIETANAHLDDFYVAANLGVRAGQYVVIAVSDSGTGMPPDVLAKVFDPFFTTKGVGKGSGLGLSQVHGFVSQSNGYVKIYSEVGRGTAFKIYLGRHVGEAEAAAKVAEDAGDVLPVGSFDEVVLVVEDEEHVREMSVSVLNELGYTVHQAKSGVDALRLLEKKGGVGLLFTDIVMPGMTGRELADAARARYPELKVLYTTGYTRNAVVHNGLLDADVAFLTKPFSVAQLARKVRAVFDGGGLYRSVARNKI